MKLGPLQSRFFRAYFNYDPKKDPANPCQEASFSFELGDILEVVSTQDESWWHARKYGTPAGGSSVGLIPTAHQRLKHLSSRAGGAVCSENLGPRAPRRKLKKKKEMKVPLAERDPREPLTYLEVTLVKPSKKKRRPVIVTGWYIAEIILWRGEGGWYLWKVWYLWGFGICGELVFVEGWYLRGVGICGEVGLCGELVFVGIWYLWGVGIFGGLVF